MLPRLMHAEQMEPRTLECVQKRTSDDEEAHKSSDEPVEPFQAFLLFGCGRRRRRRRLWETFASFNEGSPRACHDVTITMRNSFSCKADVAQYDFREDWILLGH